MTSLRTTRPSVFKALKSSGDRDALIRKDPKLRAAAEVLDETLGEAFRTQKQTKRFVYVCAKAVLRKAIEAGVSAEAVQFVLDSMPEQGYTYGGKIGKRFIPKQEVLLLQQEAMHAAFQGEPEPDGVRLLRVMHRFSTPVLLNQLEKRTSAKH